MSKDQSIYVTDENEARLMAMYNIKLARWPVSYENVFVPTSFGRTHIIENGPKAGHLMNTEEPEFVNNRILEFLE